MTARTKRIAEDDRGDANCEGCSGDTTAAIRDPQVDADGAHGLPGTVPCGSECEAIIIALLYRSTLGDCRDMNFASGAVGEDGQIAFAKGFAQRMENETE